MIDFWTRNGGVRAVGTLCAALIVALALDIGVCLLPENDYQRWQLLHGTIFERLRWAYERIHFDPRPVDVAILGPSKTMLGLSAETIEQQLSLNGRSANVANFSIPAGGRNLEWAIVNELYKAKSPKVIVIGVDAAPYPYGHPAFKFVAPAGAIAFPPAPLLHSYFHDIAYLPSRKARLFAASLFPKLFGLSEQFDPEAYAQTRTDFTHNFREEGKTIDMEHEVPRQTLLAQADNSDRSSLVARVLTWCCNDGDDHVYIREIAQKAKAHATRLIFVFLPTFGGSQVISDRSFIAKYGIIVDNGDLAQQDRLFENWAHLNHAGAVAVSDRVAHAIAGTGGFRESKSLRLTPGHNEGAAPDE